jgi:uncharacterized membrane protein
MRRTVRLQALICINTIQHGQCSYDGVRKEPVMWSSDYWPMFFGPVMMLVLFFVCLAILGMMRSGRAGRAIEILKERYARGEINNAEFEERRRLLEA